MTFSGLAAEIEDLIGLEKTVELLRWRGGCEISIPVHVAQSRLAQVIGHDAAQAMARHFGPGKMLLPCAHVRGAEARRAEALELLRAGQSLAQVALACGMHSRTVSRLRRQIEAEQVSRQFDLPFDS